MGSPESGTPFALPLVPAHPHHPGCSSAGETYQVESQLV